MKVSKGKAFEWVLFIGLCIIAGWFASGVVMQFFSRKTSFSRYEDRDTKYPVIIIEFNQYSLSQVEVYYKGARDHRSAYAFPLKIGENHYDDYR